MPGAQPRDCAAAHTERNGLRVPVSLAQDVVLRRGSLRLLRYVKAHAPAVSQDVIEVAGLRNTTSVFGCGGLGLLAGC